VALEHARAISSKALGEAQAIMISVHNTPFGDIVDTEDDLQPLVFSMFRDATRTVKLVAATMRTAEFDAERLEARAGDGWATLTELADTLVRDHGLPFRLAHAISGSLMTASRREPSRLMADLLAETSAAVLSAPIVYSPEALARIMTPRYFVSVRRTYGGPAPEESANAADASRLQLDADQAWWTRTIESLAAGERRLEAEAAAL
jgi:argininosuccinate lyase